ncbi:hypothetical protein DL96DRAFT_120326 [Flagelloscypha sp. PMI_526]|nr:hypothetical protein DL96DRAFT_120326 [Flagelloscypha sp. PMI_526]
MSQEPAPVDVTRPSPQRTLQFVWTVANKPEELYAIAPLPATYDDALRVAIGLFPTQITTSEPENFTLKLSTRNRQGYFVWATINPANWKLLVTGEDPVAVFETPSEDAFLRGSVYLVPGRRLNGKTEWKTPLSWKRGTSLQINDLVEADRPLSYEDAMLIVKNSELLFPSDSSYPFAMPEASNLDTSNKGLQFVEFHTDNLQSWSAFPVRAYGNAKVWRQVVPEPGKLLGVLLTD